MAAAAPRVPPHEPGSVVVWREVWRGSPWTVWSAFVVEDTPARCILYRPIGAEGRVPVGPRGRCVRSAPLEAHEPRVWTDRHLLQIAEPGEPFSIWLFWDADWQPEYWYVNLEQPWRRTPHGFDTMDHELDVVVRLDRSVEWKDEERLAQWVREGAHTQSEADAFRAVGERVLAERVAPWTAPFSEGWESWRPPAAWGVPALPSGWGDVP